MWRVELRRVELRVGLPRDNPRGDWLCVKIPRVELPRDEPLVELLRAELPAGLRAELRARAAELLQCAKGPQ